jgi:hypothetical protein
LKFLVLTDSTGNPRTFPHAYKVGLEETYPYLLRKAFEKAIFYQLSFGNITTDKLLNQAIGYLSDWSPDFIVIQSGMADSRPEAFSETSLVNLHSILGPAFNKYKKYIYHPRLIKFRNLHRVKPQSFHKTLKKFKIIFSNSNILWLEICAAPNYEKDRPGVLSRICEYNSIIKKIYGSNYIYTQNVLNEVKGFNPDSMHWNKKGHTAIAKVLKDKINSLI